MAEQIQAVGMIEFNSIAAGIEAADQMVKAAQVEPLMLKTICPGKFVVAVHATVSAVQSALEAGLATAPDAVVDHFLIPNLDPQVVGALAGAVALPPGGALGVIETFSAAAAIVAADTAAKAAQVVVWDIRLAMGLGGKAFCLLGGQVGAVEQAVEAGSRQAADKGLLVRRLVIPNLAPQVLAHIG